MRLAMTRKVPLLFALLAALAGQAAFGQDLVEKVVVRNRLYSMKAKWEAGADVGFTLLSRLTDNINLNVHGAYNLDDTLGFELRGGYGISRHTSLATQIANDFYANPSIKTADDLTELWEMTANAVIGVRWAPIYGKISLMAELPVHFQAYLWVGAGGALLKRQSIVYCTSAGVDADTGEKVCGSYLSENKFSPVVSAAVGARFFVTPQHSVKLEIRDWSYPDSYLVGINRATAMAGGETGALAKNPGIINLVQVDVGYSYVF
jgi:outer membrane beta-barrel protein